MKKITTALTINSITLAFFIASFMGCSTAPKMAARMIAPGASQFLPPIQGPRQIQGPPAPPAADPLKLPAKMPEKFIATDGTKLTKADLEMIAPLTKAPPAALGNILIANIPAPPADFSVYTAVKKVSLFLWFAGFCFLAAAGLLYYIGQYIPAIKYTIAGVALPVGAIFFQAHYVVIFSVILIASALGFLWGTRNSSLSKSVETALASGAGKVETEIGAAATAVENKVAETLKKI